MGRYASRRSEVKNLAFAFVVAIVASLLVWLPNWNLDDALATGDLGYNSEIDYTASLPGTSSTDGVTLEDAQVIPANSSFTVELWVKPDALTKRWNQLLHNFTGSNYQRFDINIGGGTINSDVVQVLYNPEASPKTAKMVNTSSNLLRAPIGEWTHIAVTVDKTSGDSYTLKTYQNGQLVQTATQSDVDFDLMEDDFYVGYHSSSNDRSLEGQLDQIKVWDGALSQLEIESSMHTLGAPAGVSGLRAHYDFNEGTGTTIHDRAGSYDLTATNLTFADVKSVATDDDDLVVTFPRTYLPGVGGWTVPAGVSNVDALLVAGGGGGSGNWPTDRDSAGGSGGGGGVYSATGLEISGTVSVVVGQGGVGGPSSTSRTATVGNPGQNSWLSSLSAGGGGGGGCVSSSDGDSDPSACAADSINGRDGNAAGSGGSPSNFWNAYDYGEPGTASSVTIGTKTFAAVRGFRGGTYVAGSSAAYTAGSGGGAGGVGSTNSPGVGIASTISGASATYGAGGASYNSASRLGAPTNANTGNGGEGAYLTSEDARGFSGGSGVLIVRLSSTISISLGSTTLGYGETTSVAASGGVGSGSLTLTETSGNCTISGANLTMKQNSSGSCTIVATKAADTSGGYPEQSTSATITVENKVDLGNLSLAVSSTTSLDPTFYVQDPTTSGMILAASLRVSGSGTLTMGSAGEALISDEADLSEAYGFSDRSEVAEISLRGTASLLDRALSDVTYNAPGSGSSGELILKVTEVPEDTDYYYDAVTGHYYLYVASAGISATSARILALAKSLFGQSGYLANLTTERENDFVADNVDATNIWFGASDQGNGNTYPHNWYWLDGPEAGVAFFEQSGGSGSGGGSNLAGGFSSWAAGEPNGHSGNDENYAGTNYGGALGMWNDFRHNNTGLEGYLVEFGGLGDFIRIEASVSPTVTIVEGSGAPSSVTATQTTTNGQIALAWSSPMSDGGSAVSDYIVEYKPAGGSWTSFSDGVSTNTTTTVTGLQPCLSHDFRIKAYNDYFYSAASSTASATPVWGNFETLEPKEDRTKSLRHWSELWLFQGDRRSRLTTSRDLSRGRQHLLQCLRSRRRCRSQRTRQLECKNQEHHRRRRPTRRDSRHHHRRLQRGRECDLHQLGVTMNLTRLR